MHVEKYEFNAQPVGHSSSFLLQWLTIHHDTMHGRHYTSSWLLAKLQVPAHSWTKHTICKRQKHTNTPGCAVTVMPNPNYPVDNTLHEWWRMMSSINYTQMKTSLNNGWHTMQIYKWSTQNTQMTSKTHNKQRHHDMIFLPQNPNYDISERKCKAFSPFTSRRWINGGRGDDNEADGGRRCNPH